MVLKKYRVENSAYLGRLIRADRMDPCTYISCVNKPLAELLARRGLYCARIACSHCGELGLAQETDLELILWRLVDLDINFLARFRNLYSFPVT